VPPALESFGERLKWAREQKDMTWEALAAQVRVHYTTIWRWETGKSDPPRVEKIRELAKALDVAFAWLVG
jgi:transcriptional regulator with XRE-family HTH domain